MVAGSYTSSFSMSGLFSKNCEAVLKKNIPAVQWVFFEPDIE